MNTASKKRNERLQPFVARRAFMLIELLVLITVLALLVFTQMARLSEAREKLFVTIDLNNMRQILRASALYNADHDDQMAHPTWGSDLTSPDGWAYLTSTKNESVPGALQPTPGSCTGRDITSRQFTNQLAFFKAGQVTRYYRTWKPPGGPKDVATRTSAGLKSAWLGRSMKVTSYCWTATIAGLVGPKRENRTNRTYKLSRFLPTDWQTWEKPDSVILGAPPGFTFNDAGANPENVGETLSLRHSNDMNWWKNLQIKRDIAGGAIVGIFGGAARYVSIPHLTDLAVRKIPAPNELLNGPDYAR